MEASKEVIPLYRTCPTCKKRFVFTHGNMRYCSDDCINKGYRKRSESKRLKHFALIGQVRDCRRCGTTFELTRKNAGVKFYCNKCSINKRFNRMRIAIAGAPKTGKTTLASKLDKQNGKEVYHTDSVKHKEWSEASLIVSRWFDEVEGPIIVEGVRVPHALRKWLERHEDDGQRPVDTLYVLDQAQVAQTSNQKAMGRGATTVLESIEDKLRARGVNIIYGLPEKYK